MRVISLTLAVLLSACAQAPGQGPGGPPPSPSTSEARPLTEVAAVQLAVMESNPPGLSVRVRGTAPTPGYANLTLRPFNYIQAPPDGIYDFTAVGQAPGGMVAQVLSPVEFTYTWRAYPSGLKGVRIHAGAGQVTTMLPASR